jgi:hypothetical protein
MTAIGGTMTFRCRSSSSATASSALSLLGGQRRGQEPSGHVAVNRPVEDAVADQGLDFRKMLATSLVTLGIVAEVCRFREGDALRLSQQFTTWHGCPD